MKQTKTNMKSEKKGKMQSIYNIHMVYSKCLQANAYANGIKRFN